MAGCWASASLTPGRTAIPNGVRKTNWQMFKAERPSLVPYALHFDGFHGVPAADCNTRVVQFDKNKCAVSSRAVGRPVEIRAYDDRTELPGWGDCR